MRADLLYVTHALSVVAEFRDSLSVMYAGGIVEQLDDLAALIAAPAHPDTRALLASMPRIKGAAKLLRRLANSAPSLTDRQVAPFTAEDERFFARGDQARRATNRWPRTCRSRFPTGCGRCTA